MRNHNLELYRCLCMFGVVCIHSFTWAGEVSHRCWALSCPFLIGFVMISGWFGIHYKVVKVLRLMGVVVVCSTLGHFLGGQGGGISPQAAYGKGYWYIWAYVFVMILSPFVDFFVETCQDRQKMIKMFFAVGVLLWGWSFLAQTASQYIPSVSGFGGCSGVILFCIYVQVRLLKSLGWAKWLAEHRKILWGVFLISVVAVFLGFRHDNSVFAFVYAFSILLFVNSLKLPDSIGKFFSFLAPSMFSVYLLHMPLGKYFPTWESLIGEWTHFPHPLCQFILAIFVFVACIVLDLPRRGLVRLMKRAWS